MDIGTCLREAREGRSITLRQLADSTKLSTRVLQFIERNEFKRLPGGIFTKAYLRAYAVEVGVDPEGVVGEYLAQFPAPIVAERPSGPSLALGNSHAGRYVLAAVAVAVAVVALRGVRLSAGCCSVVSAARSGRGAGAGRDARHRQRAIA